VTNDEMYDYAKYLVTSHLEDGVEYLSVNEQFADYADREGLGIPEWDWYEDHEDDLREVHKMANKMLSDLAEVINRP
jgi:hypothetical protein